MSIYAHQFCDKLGKFIDSDQLALGHTTQLKCVYKRNQLNKLSVIKTNDETFNLIEEIKYV